MILKKDKYYWFRNIQGNIKLTGKYMYYDRISGFHFFDETKFGSYCIYDDEIQLIAEIDPPCNPGLQNFSLGK